MAKLCKAVIKAKGGFPLNDQLFQLIVRRYSDEQGNMDFDNFIGCLVRLDAMHDNGRIKVNIQEVNSFSLFPLFKWCV
uniref:Uncharacterized protein n=1 Tax=Oncorhynchus tshawytscha TaxID=74940 RepID=A0A8C8FWH5_ONCTS